MSMITATTDAELYSSLGLGRELEAKRDSGLQMEDFMKLMITQLTHQDPFKPMDNTELATQISQFATVSGIEQLNSTFSDLSESMVSGQALQAATLVGRNVLVPLSSGALAAGGTLKGVVGLSEPASNVTVRISDPSGALLKEINLGTRPKGEVHFTWDGLDENGDLMPPGQYQVEAQAMSNDVPVSPYILVEAQVASVSIGAPGQGIALNLLGLGAISFNDVAEIR